MKKIKFIFIGLGIIVLCYFLGRNYYYMEQDISNFQKHSVAPNNDYEDIDQTATSLPSKNDEVLELMGSKAKSLYDELLIFKNNSDFHQYGFSRNYKYFFWMQSVGNLRDIGDKEFSAKYGFSLGGLEMLGLEYIQSKGKETRFSLWTRERIENGLLVLK